MGPPGSTRGMGVRGKGFSGGFAAFEAPTLVAGLDDIAMVREPVEQRGRHLGVAEHRWPFAEGQVGGDDDGSLLIEPADQVEQQLSARERERQITKFVENHEVEPREMIGDPAGTPGPGLGLEAVDQVDGVVEPDPGPGTHAGTADRYGEVGFAGAGAADQHGVALAGEEAAGREVADQHFIDRRRGEVEAGDLFGQRQLGDRQLVLDRTRLLLGDLGLKQIADDALSGVLALHRIGDDVVIGMAHTGKLQFAHHLQYLVAFHRTSSGCRSGRSQRPARGEAARLRVS